GQGEMFVQLSPSMISSLVQEFHLDKMDQSLIEEYLKLDPASRQILKDYIRRVYLAAEEADDQAEIDREVEEYRHELENEKRASSASGSSDGPEPKASGE
ncbi:MAG: hypothetical protein LUD50_02990, partial [Clostridia bacterium]|nr:hypothetical protein [Clostridia bacterium]